MKIFLTGATGFIGGRMARMLRDRGDDVTCLVRDPQAAESLGEIGCRLVQGDLSDEAHLSSEMAGHDAVIHGAAMYEVGIPDRKRPAMHEANVEGARNALQAAGNAGAGKIVYVSTVAVFGNTRGEVVDESYDLAEGEYTSYYEETKVEAHRVARALTDDGLPIAIAQPGAVYGPGDHSSVGNTLEQFASGKLPALPFPDLGLTLVYVDDAADGVLRVLDSGSVGRSYVLGGEVATMRQMIETAAPVVGRKPPRMSVPTGVLKALKPFGPLVGAGMGQPPNLGELITSADGVTFWASSDRAREELGYDPRTLKAGLSQTLS